MSAGSRFVSTFLLPPLTRKERGDALISWVRSFSRTAKNLAAVSGVRNIVQCGSRLRGAASKSLCSFGDEFLRRTARRPPESGGPAAAGPYGRGTRLEFVAKVAFSRVLPIDCYQQLAKEFLRRRLRPRLAAPQFYNTVGLVVAFLVSSGCGRYAEFTLPPLSGGDPHLTFALESQAAPILSPSDGWGSHDVLNPSVVRSPWTNGSLLNLYSGFDGHTWHTGLASSADGIRWQKLGKILSPDPQTWEGSYIAANGSALSYANQVWYWYVAGPEELPNLGLARASQPGNWRKEPAPALKPGPYDSWDERGVADPYVIRIEPYFYLYYLGQDRARRQRLGVARSSDGLQWEKLRSNPVLELGDIGAFDEAALGEPAVWSSDGFYWMLYTGLDPKNNRRLGIDRKSVV